MLTGTTKISAYEWSTVNLKALSCNIRTIWVRENHCLGFEVTGALLHYIVTREIIEIYLTYSWDTVMQSCFQ